jgi:1-pyrroline-5-carboxylate dehydrogenase
MKKFANEPVLDFSNPDDKKKQQAALDSFEVKEYPLIIGGERIHTDDKIVRRNSCTREEIVGTVSRADKALAERAMQTAADTFQTWKKVPASERAEILFKAANILRERRFEINATMILEASKHWIEADADTAEAIDFLDYYAHEMLRYANADLVTPIPGEKNNAFYIPLGVGVVIAPWNFPCAILTGMTMAAAVAGNTVVMKPASTGPVVAYKMMEIFEEAGLPAGVVNYLPCPGGEVGDYLVDHKETRFISFTGSREIGCRIYERAAKVHPGQLWLKRVVAEMGGKDAIVIADDADLEAASTAAVASAYGFQGQKCSACSRLIVDEKVYDTVVEKVVEKTKNLTIGDVRNFDNYMGGVVDEKQFEKIKEYIEIGKKEGKLLYGGETQGPGLFVQPTVIADVDAKARIAQEEIFGPVLAIIKAKDYDDALRIANDTDYGLTGAVYSTSRERIEQARNEFHVGNLYFNRKCTGALVGGHPFGGFNMSGTDSKAGGRDYLLLFLQAKLTSEKV